VPHYLVVQLAALVQHELSRLEGEQLREHLPPITRAWDSIRRHSSASEHKRPSSFFLSSSCHDPTPRPTHAAQRPSGACVRAAGRRRAERLGGRAGTIAWSTSYAALGSFSSLSALAVRSRASSSTCVAWPLGSART
jgi:hypothetical protein